MRVASVVCAVCPGAATSFCLSCFTSGAEPGEHKAWHGYRVRNNLHAMKIFRSDWTAAEELALLDGVLKHGLGNWRDVAAAVGTKSERRCEEHYLDDYLGRHGRILPERTLAKTLVPADPNAPLPPPPPVGRARSASSSSSSSASASSESATADGAVAAPAEETVATEALLPPDEQLPTARARHEAAAASSAAALAASDAPGRIPWGPERDPLPGAACPREALRDLPRATIVQVNERISQLPGARLGGFLPLRGDFDVEHENDAELLLADMEFRPTDPPAERALKLDVAKVYNAKLDERERRKRFVVERGLVDYAARAAEDRKRPRDERDLLARLRVFARFQTPEEHEALVKGCVEAKRLRKRIALLQHYRSLGIRTLAEADAYEAERDAQQPGSARPQALLAMQLAAASNSSGGGGGSSSSSSTGGLPPLFPSASASSSSSSSSSLSSSLSSSTPRPDQPRADEGDAPASPARAQQTEGGGGGRGSAVKSLAALVASPASAGAGAAASSAAAAAQQAQFWATDDVRGAAGVDAEAAAALGVATGEADRAAVLGSPGAELLSAQEVDLCSALQLAPNHYLAAKDALVRQALAAGILPTKSGGGGSGGGGGAAAAAQLVKLDVHRTGQVYDFLIDCGWLQSLDPAAAPALHAPQPTAPVADAVPEPAAVAMTD